MLRRSIISLRYVGVRRISGLISTQLGTELTNTSANTSAPLTPSIMMTTHTSRLGSSVLRAQLKQLLNQGLDPSFSLQNQQLKGVMYNLKAVNDKTLTKQIIERFVQPLGTTVAPSILTLSLQALKMAEDLPAALQLLDQHIQSNTANIIHVTAMLGLLRDMNLRPANRSDVSGARARIVKGLELYHTAVITMPQAEGSTALSCAALLLIHSATKDLLTGTPAWLDEAHDIVNRHKAVAPPNHHLYGHLIMLAAKMPREVRQGYGAAKAVHEDMLSTGLKDNLTIFNALTFAATESREPKICIELYEQQASLYTPSLQVFSNYIKACIMANEVEKGLAAMQEWQEKEPSSALMCKYFLRNLSVLYNMSLALDAASGQKIPPTPRPLQLFAMRALVDRLRIILAKPGAEDDVAISVVTGAVSYELACRGLLDQLVQRYPRGRDFLADDASAADAAAAGVIVRRRGGRIAAFWDELAYRLRLEGKWRNLLSLNERMWTLTNMRPADKLSVLGECMLALAAVGRGDQALRLVNVLEVRKLLRDDPGLADCLLLSDRSRRVLEHAEEKFLLKVREYLSINVEK